MSEVYDERMCEKLIEVILQIIKLEIHAMFETIFQFNSLLRNTGAAGPQLRKSWGGGEVKGHGYILI